MSRREGKVRCEESRSALKLPAPVPCKVEQLDRELELDRVHRSRKSAVNAIPRFQSQTWGKNILFKFILSGKKYFAPCILN